MIIVVVHGRDVATFLTRWGVEPYHMISLLLRIRIQALSHPIKVEVAILLLVLTAVKLQGFLLCRAFITWKTARRSSNLHRFIQGVWCLIKTNIIRVDRPGIR